MKKWALACTFVFAVGAVLFFSQRGFKFFSSGNVEQVTENGSSPDQQKQAQHIDASKDAAVQNSEQTGPNATSTHSSSPGATHIASGAKSEETLAEKPKPQEKPQSNCFVYEFQHKPEAKHKDIEDFMDFSNAFPIAHKEFNAKSLCVKVNQQPVSYKIINTKSQTEVLLGSIVGPESLIRVSYCTGKAMCKESCAAPKKRFMDDLVSDAEADDEFGDSWGNSGEQKKKLKDNVKAFRSIAKENDSLTKQSVMRDWKTVNHSESVCKKEGN